VRGNTSIYRSCSVLSVVFLRNFTLCTDIISHLGKKACVSSTARIFWKFRVFMYCRCLEMMDIVVYEYLLTPVFISFMLNQVL